MTDRRRYSNRQKATAVVAAEMSSIQAASEQLGIPERTIRHWRDRPELAALAAKTREEMADDIKLVAALALERLAEAIESGAMEPRDLITAFGVAIDKSQLLAGAPTERTETRSLTDGLDDHEKRLLRDAIDAALAAAAGSAGEPAG